MTNKFIEILLFIFLFIPACLYITLNKENIDINEFREASGYDLVELSDGITAYKDIGNKSDKTIVLIHGATFGSLAYEDYLDVFVSNNYRVIIYDQYGRGYSDRLTGDISIELMERQLSELIEYCEIDNVILYGISFGAAVAAKYAASNIDKIDFIGYQVPLINSADVSIAILFTFSGAFFINSFISSSTFLISSSICLSKVSFFMLILFNNSSLVSLK